MNVFSLGALLLLTALTVAACGAPAESPAAPSPADGDALVGTRWVMEGEIPGRGTIRAGIELKADGTASGHTGVNRTNGTYELSGASSLAFGPMVTTRMAGTPEAMDREQLFLGALAKTRNWHVAGGTLELRAGDEVLLTLVADE